MYINMNEIVELCPTRLFNKHDVWNKLDDTK